MKINTERFTQFLIKAKKSTYAGAGDDFSLPSPLPDSKMLSFVENELEYRDIYFGMQQFSGQEVVSLKGQTIWSMTYSGRSIQNVNVSGVYEFLRQALLQVSADAPFRGPKKLFDNTGLRYQNSFQGNIDFFSGEESIWHNDSLLYRLYYTGGWIS